VQLGFLSAKNELLTLSLLIKTRVLVAIGTPLPIKTRVLVAAYDFPYFIKLGLSKGVIS
jgi:hypothetical protein